MTNIHSAKLSIVVSLLAVGLLCMLGFGGCSESVSSAPNADSILSNSEHEFQTQANRPPTSKTLFAMADILATQGRDSECEFVLKRIIRENPRYLPAYNSLAELQMRQGHTNTAIETIHDAFRINSEDPVLLNNLGICWMVRGDYEKALEMFTRAAGIMPENARYRTNTAVALGLMARYEESLSLFKQVLSEDQANHNLSVLREAGKNVNPTSACQESP
jgi:Flp pilus assembly protein TadD